MVKKIFNRGREYYECEECFLLYLDKKTASRCESWCKENKSCNLDITKKSINKVKLMGKHECCKNKDSNRKDGCCGDKHKENNDGHHCKCHDEK